MNRRFVYLNGQVNFLVALEEDTERRKEDRAKHHSFRAMPMQKRPNLSCTARTPTTLRSATMDSRSSWQRTRQEGALDAEALASSAVVAKIRRRRQVNATGGSKVDVDVAELSMTGNPPPVDGKHQSTNIRFGNDIRAAPRDCIHDCAESPECRLFCSQRSTSPVQSEM